jgi:membrane associated rhomboid family serine protease
MSSRRHPMQLTLYASMLARQMGDMGLLQPGRKKPAVTLILAGACVAVYLFDRELQRYLPFKLDARGAGLMPAEMLEDFQRNWPRLFTSALLHGSEMHLFLNLSSLLYKGAILEDYFGSKKFAVMVGVLTGLASLAAVCLSRLAMSTPLAPYATFYSYHIGLSALLFALKVVVNFDPRLSGEVSQVMGFTVSNRWVPWIELFYAQLMMPNVSFVGHLGGIVAGMAYVATTTPDLPRFMQFAPAVALLAPVRWLWSRTFGALGGGHGGGQRFNHHPDGYVLGRRPSPAALPAASSSSSASQFRGPSQRFPSPTPASSYYDGPSAAPAASSAAEPLRPDLTTLRGHGYADGMQSLWEMGFHDRRANHSALQRTRGDVPAAVELLSRQR